MDNIIRKMISCPWAVLAACSVYFFKKDQTRLYLPTYTVIFYLVLAGGRGHGTWDTPSVNYRAQAVPLFGVKVTGAKQKHTDQRSTISIFAKYKYP